MGRIASVAYLVDEPEEEIIFMYLLQRLIRHSSHQEMICHMATLQWPGRQDNSVQ